MKTKQKSCKRKEVRWFCMTNKSIVAPTAKRAIENAISYMWPPRKPIALCKITMIDGMPVSIKLVRKHGGLE